MNRFITILFIFLLLIGCTIPIIQKPVVGMEFDARTWADTFENGKKNGDGDNFYNFQRKVKDGVIYKPNPKYSRDGDFKGALLVSGDIVRKVFSESEYATFIEAENRIAQEEQERVNQENVRIAQEKIRIANIEKETQLKKLKDEELKKYGTTGVVMNVSSIRRACLRARDIFECLEFDSDLTVSAGIKNNTNKIIRDIEIECRHFAQSGTVITSEFGKFSEIIFQKWSPSEIREFKFRISEVQQSVRVECSIKNWK